MRPSPSLLPSPLPYCVISHPLLVLVESFLLMCVEYVEVISDIISALTGTIDADTPPHTSPLSPPLVLLLLPPSIRTPSTP